MYFLDNLNFSWNMFQQQIFIAAYSLIFSANIFLQLGLVIFVNYPLALFKLTRLKLSNFLIHWFPETLHISNKFTITVCTCPALTPLSNHCTE